MSETLRQARLFAGEDWKVIYQAFTQISFAAYDYDTIRAALIDYIRVNYPEDFNDWIESSEFVSIIEMLAYVAGSLAFRLDLNTRENFMDTATRRESVFRLARYLSYTPRRCLTSQGLLKIQSVRTNETIYDSNGVNLANQTIFWNDANNPDWLEQFILVLNASLLSTNPYGVPVKSGIVGTIPAERYDFNNSNTSVLAYNFTSTVSGTSMQFEFCNTDFDVQGTQTSLLINNTGFFKEKTPNVFNSWSMVYRTDGNGNASAQTGFFMLFKQGTLAYADYVLDASVPNRVIDITATNVNQSDVWVQTVDDTGIPLLDWTRVPALFSSNLVYNSVNRLTRDIYQVVTRDQNGQDVISIRFGDGNFGNIPRGRIRVYYRTSNNLTYNIQPQDIQNKVLSFGYVNSLGNNQVITLTCGLTYPVTNSLSRETTESIKQRAPAVFYTQNRMVNGEDYNLFPLQNSQALKVKAVNRIYSGQSRYLTATDPTGTYSNTKVFSDDGIFYKQFELDQLQIPINLNLNVNQIIQTQIQPWLHGGESSQNVNVGLRNFYFSEFPPVLLNSKWINTGSTVGSVSQGQFENIILPDLSKGLTTHSMFAYGDPGDTVGVSPYKYWATIQNVNSSQLGSYSVIVNRAIPDNAPVWASYPPLRVSLTDAEQQSLASALTARKNFGMRYSTSTCTWQIVDGADLAINAPFNLSTAGSTTKQNLDASWLLQFLYEAGVGWSISMRTLSYVFESVSDVRFYVINTQPVVNTQTLTSVRDQIRILKYNTNSQSQPLGSDQLWAIQGPVYTSDARLDASQVKLEFWDSNQDNQIDDPEMFDRLVTNLDRVYWQQQTAQGVTSWTPFQVKAVYQNTQVVPNAQVTQLFVNQDVIYVTDSDVFLQYQSSPAAWLDVSQFYKAREGRNGLNYCWQHYASSESRIDPAIQNVIDVYVLTTNYDTSMRTWTSKGRLTDPEPEPPTGEDLALQFAEFDRYKMMTDQLIWHPVRYKLLFGAQAEPELRAQFKVVRIAGSTVTDSEIRSAVIQAVDQYFDVTLWDFGQSFYFTELAAYIHQQLPTLISSVVIVPVNSTSQFGDLFEITCDPDQLFLSAARVSDVQVVSSLTPAELRINR